MDRKRLQTQRTIQKILWKKLIHSNTTENETKSAFAERNIRSLKNLIYRFLEEKWSWSYITEIPQFVNIDNSRVNRFAKLALNKVFKKLEPYLNSLSLDKNKYKQAIATPAKKLKTNRSAINHPFQFRTASSQRKHCW